MSFWRFIGSLKVEDIVLIVKNLSINNVKNIWFELFLEWLLVIEEWGWIWFVYIYGFGSLFVFMMLYVFVFFYWFCKILFVK